MWHRAEDERTLAVQTGSAVVFGPIEQLRAGLLGVHGANFLLQEGWPWCLSLGVPGQLCATPTDGRIKESKEDSDSSNRKPLREDPFDPQNAERAVALCQRQDVGDCLKETKACTS